MAGGDGRGQSSQEDYVDHYAVLGLPSGEEGSKLSLKEIKKAYRNQSRIRHPDKRPDDPNATADFQLLTSSFDFLLDKVKRSDFDAKLRARREWVLRDSFQDAKRRKMATDLEERERSAAVAVDPAEEVRLKEKMKADELKREIAEFKARRAKKASVSIYGQQNGENKVGGEKAGPSLDKGRTLKVSWETSSGDYSAAKLRGIFESFGIVEDVVIRSNSSKKRASAFIVMASRESTVRAVQNMSGELKNPLLVLPLEPIAPSFSCTSSTNQSESLGPEFNNVVGAGFRDFEASVMKKLQERTPARTPPFVWQLKFGEIVSYRTTKFVVLRTRDRSSVPMSSASLPPLPHPASRSDITTTLKGGGDGVFFFFSGGIMTPLRPPAFKA